VGKSTSPRWRHLLPWVVSAGTLGYVFGYATDWQALLAATEGANIPLFLVLATVDKMIFFLWWGILQAAAVRRFVVPVSTREVIAVRGGAELMRVINNPLADAAFLYGLSRLTRGHLAAVVAAAGVPLACHFSVLLAQSSLALFFLEGGIAANREVYIATAVGWAAVGMVVVSVHTGHFSRVITSTPFGAWMLKVRARDLVPLIGWFVLLAGFDVLIQGLASRAFGVPLPWWPLAARLPILYVVLSLPSFGNFGTREIAWAAFFSDYAPRETLVAYALSMNTIFLLLHVVIGVIFLPRAMALISEVRQARREGKSLPAPMLRDASDP
jgi:hypothetical protein